MTACVRLLLGFLAVLLASTANAATFTVINANDSGAGSTRGDAQPHSGRRTHAARIVAVGD